MLYNDIKKFIVIEGKQEKLLNKYIRFIEYSL